jgi:hypothetical protein
LIREKNITIKCDFGGKYQEVRNHPMAIKEDKISSRLNNCPFEINGKKVDGKWRFVVNVPIITILLLHLKSIQCINVWMRHNLDQALL